MYAYIYISDYKCVCIYNVCVCLFVSLFLSLYVRYFSNHRSIKTAAMAVMPPHLRAARLEHSSKCQAACLQDCTSPRGWGLNPGMEKAGSIVVFCFMFLFPLLFALFLHQLASSSKGNKSMPKWKPTPSDTLWDFLGSWSGKVWRKIGQVRNHK